MAGHYYGSSAEPLLTPQLLPLLIDDIEGLQEDRGLPAAVAGFLHDTCDLCRRALRAQKTTQLAVFAD